MTDLESPRKNNDCYFYYYSTCAKGDSCTFRHEPSALGCETMCSFWKEGKCLNVHCNFRHMELRKNRKAIQCYWETQPNGCLRAHCPFLHQNSRPMRADDSIDSKTDSGTESADNTMNEKMNHINEKSFKNPPVDSLVVNFEEESDNESAPTNSPLKPSHYQRSVEVKTLEEIKLERIQAESAAYYSYFGEAAAPDAPAGGGEAAGSSADLRKRILDRISLKGGKRRLEGAPEPAGKRARAAAGEIRVKTLQEIRAEREARRGAGAICDSLVTSSDDVREADKPRKIKLIRGSPKEGRGEFGDEDVAMKGAGEEGERVAAEEGGKLAEQEEEMGDGGELYQKLEKETDEVLLLGVDDDDSVSLKDEDELLNDIDDFED